MALPPKDADRIIKLLGMLGIDHEGEVANAGRAADKLVRALKLTWHDVVALAPNPTPPPEEARISRLQRAVNFLLNHSDLLTDWEHRFVWSIRARRLATLTERQDVVFRKIIEKVHRAL